MPLNEDTLVQQTTADYLENELGWESIYAYNSETFGWNGTLGRGSDHEVILKPRLRKKLEELNPGLPASAYEEAIRRLTDVSGSLSPIAENKEKHDLLRDGVVVNFHNERGELAKERLRVFNFDDPVKNDFLCVRELWVRGDLYRRRADIIGFVNGIPLLFIECKNLHKDLRTAFNKNLSDYRDTVPHLLHHNAVLLLANGEKAKIGTVSSKYEHFHEWKRLHEEEPGVVDMETLLKGVCSKRNFLDLFENFIVFDESSGKTVKILARNHQFLGVNLAMEAVKDRENREKKLGVFWHTQGSGKSYSMVFFARKVRRKLGGGFTFVICTDREDLDTQIYKTFAGCGLADNDRERCRAAGGDDLRTLLGQQLAYIFTLVHKFNQVVDPEVGFSQRDDIIVISDEAHRSQYGTLALNMRNALPRACFMGFTGTPLFKGDEITRKVFGDYVSTYDFKRAVDDHATVPLYYDARGERLGIATTDLNKKIADKLEELATEDFDKLQRLEQELKREYHIITADKRLDQVARDFVEHYSTSWETGKAMVVCIDKITCVRMHGLIEHYWKERIAKLEADLGTAEDEQEEVYRRRQIQWMKDTLVAVVVSEEQGEVAKFQKWDLDIRPHRKRLKEGFDIPEHLKNKPEFMGRQRLDVDDAFKEEEHPFRVAIVCAMWLTGFDVPSLSTLYLDKPLKAHTLMQAIARANRVNEGKNNGLIVDYCGILKNLRKALATFAGAADSGRGEGEGTETDPTHKKEELLADLAESIALVERFLQDRGATLKDIIRTKGFERNSAILAAKEAANENDESRKRFEVMSREVFKKFKSCLTFPKVNSYRTEYDAINIVYKGLLDDREKADITTIIRELHRVVDEAIETRAVAVEEEVSGTYDISKIDFDRLRREFERSKKKNTTVQSLKAVIDLKLQRLLAQNPTRTDYQKHYEEIVAEYNREKDRVTIEKTFEALFVFMRGLNEEEDRAMQEGLDEESLAIFDLIKKDDLSKDDIKRIKAVAVDLLATLKAEKLRVELWREKEATRDEVRLTIHDYLWSDATGLPVDCYEEPEVAEKAAEVFRHIFRAYPELPSPFYPEAA
jgi:type I restriction enzyme R subunit